MLTDVMHKCNVSIDELKSCFPQIGDIDIRSFQTVLAVLEEHPDMLSLRGAQPAPGNSQYVFHLAKRFFLARSIKEELHKPATLPDEMVSYILQITFGWDNEKAHQAKEDHQWAMAAENLVGSLLERYVASIMEPMGWAWCSGNFVRAMDFVIYEPYGWRGLQIKNRDNTENSSSSKIRDGRNIAIEKWFRTFSKKIGSNWTVFPDETGKKALSEAGFQSFVKAHLGA
jgi:hypothetical protein